MSEAILPALCVVFAAFAVWLTVRLVNRQERWAKWTTIGMAAVVLSIALLPRLQIAHWHGRADRMLSLSVSNPKTDEPVANAEIVIFRGIVEPGLGVPESEPDESDYQTQHLSTGPTGVARALHTFFSYGHERWFAADVGHVRLGNQFVRVTASGYEPVRFRLAERTGEQRDWHDKSPIELAIKLQPTAEE